MSEVPLYSCAPGPPVPGCVAEVEREFFLANLLVRIHLIIGLALWEFELPSPGSLFPSVASRLIRPTVGP